MNMQENKTPRLSYADAVTILQIFDHGSKIFELKKQLSKQGHDFYHTASTDEVIEEIEFVRE